MRRGSGRHGITNCARRKLNNELKKEFNLGIATILNNDDRINREHNRGSGDNKDKMTSEGPIFCSGGGRKRKLKDCANV